MQGERSWTRACPVVGSLVLVLVLGSPALGVLARVPMTTIYVNAETGSDCFNGLSPTPSISPPPVPPACPSPPAPAGPLKTITAALNLINPSPGVYNFTPFYVIRIAGRLDERIELEDGSFGRFFYGPGETYPLRVPPRTQLRADGANSEYDPIARTVVPVKIVGPIYTGPNTPNTVEFTAGVGDRFSTEGGLDGTEISPYGIEISGGGRTVYLFADQQWPTGSQWPSFPYGTPPPITAAMSIRIEGVWCQGGGAYGLDAHIQRGAVGDFTVSNCKFTTAMDLPNGATMPSGFSPPAVGWNHSGQALIHAVSLGTATPVTILNPTFSSNVLTVLPGPGGARPTVPWGLLIEPATNSDSTVVVTLLDVDGATNPNSLSSDPEGILAGIEYAANTSNAGPSGPTSIPRFNLTATNVRNCAYFGAAVATGAAGGNPTVTRLELSGNTFDTNGVTPPGSPAFPSWNGTHRTFVGAGLHMVYKEAGSWFIGTIASNVFNHNRTGIALLTASSGPPAGFTLPPDAPDLRIRTNTISNQILWPPGNPPAVTEFYGDGVGAIFAPTMVGGPPTAGVLGTLNTPVVFERNRVFANERHGALVGHIGVSTITPVMRNNRIYENGTAAPSGTPPALSSGGPAGDGVRIWYAGASGTTAGASLAPTLVHETIVGTQYGFGVNNTVLVPTPPLPPPGPGTPVIWNSIVYFNNTGLAPTYLPGTATGPDLQGFVLPATLPQVGVPGTVNYSDFCGAVLGVCGSQLTPPAGSFHGCISAFPDFVNPAPPPPTPPNFELRCAGGAGGACPTGCSLLCVSRCVDAGDPTGPGFPVMPVVDANELDRDVSLNQPCPPADMPDMGAIEKQGCTP